MNSHGTFPLFSCFPAEIRCLIWMFCLPRRIAEEDYPYTLLDGQDGRQACWPNSTCLQNARVPLIASVCSEARDVAFKWGHHQMSQDETSLISIWVQPKIDRALHLNWTRRRWEDYLIKERAMWPDVDDPAVMMLLDRAHYDYHIQASFVGELFYPFDLAEMMSPQTYHTDATRSHTPGIRAPDELKDPTEYDLHIVLQMHTEPTIYATLLAISLHVDKKAAIASGLFGLLGDAPVQTVDYDDRPQLRRFYNLFHSDTGLKEAEPYVEQLFKFVFSPSFYTAVHSWQKKVEWLFQAILWKQTRKGGNLTSFKGTEPGSVWTPPVPEGQYFMGMPPVLEDSPIMQSSQFQPNEDHFWWREYADRYIPRIVPQVMVRLCDNHCCKEGRLPEEFGEVSGGDHHPGHAWLEINERGWLVPKDQSI